MKRLDDGMYVAGQIDPEEIAGLARQGVSMIVNNRPDGEERGQPTDAEIRDAAEAAGIAYCYIPVATGLSDAQVKAMASAVDRPGRTLAFCRSGTRSTLLWALARARLGDDPQELQEKAEAAGYSLAPVQAFLQSH